MDRNRHQSGEDDGFDHKAKALRKVEQYRLQEEEAEEELRSLRGVDPRLVFRNQND